MFDAIKRLVNEPLIQFLLIGAVIYGAYAIYGPVDDGDARIVEVSSEQINGFINDWQRRWKRPPTREELEGIIDNYVRETMLYQQAVAMGLNEGDPITRRRMAQKLEFLTRDLALLNEPTEDELEAFFLERQARYAEPDRITFSHVFLDTKAGEAAMRAEAAALLSQLRTRGEPDADALAAGDRFILGSSFAEVTEQDVARRFGRAFSRSIMSLQPADWHGPVQSGYGAHLVYVHAFVKAPPPEFERVRESVLRNWQQRQQEQFNADFISGLKRSYTVVIDAIPEDRLLDSGAVRSSRGRTDALDQRTISEPEPLVEAASSALPAAPLRAGGEPAS